MDAANKTEKISAPSGKHDDYCDSTVLGIHASLAMLPGESSFSSISLGKGGTRRGYSSTHHTFTTTRRGLKPLQTLKQKPRGL